jgi:hypothetical protein
LVIQEIVGIPRFGIQNVGEKLKIKSLAHQFGSGCFGFSFHIQLRQNSVIFAQFVVDITHIIRAVLIYFIVVGIPAAITAEFLVLTAYNGIAAFKAGFHISSVLIFNNIHFWERKIRLICEYGFLLSPLSLHSVTRISAPSGLVRIYGFVFVFHSRF